MVKYKSDALDRTFAALADPTRRAILTQLARGARSVSALAAPFDMSLPAVSKHLAVLADANLVAREKSGREVWCRLEAEPMKDAAAWIAAYRRFWEARLDALADYLERAQSTEVLPWPKPPSKPVRRSRSTAATARRAKRSSGRSPTRRS